MDPEDSGFDREYADEVYQFLLDLHTKGYSDVCIDPRTLLSSEADRITALNRSAALEKEAQAVLRIFTNVTITPVRRHINIVLNSLNDRALLPVGNRNIVKRRDNYNINIWKNNNLVTSIQNDRRKDVLMHFINIKIDNTGSFIISGLENVDDEIREIIRELGSYVAIDEIPNFTGDNDGVQIREISDGIEPMIEVPLEDGILKFSANQNPIDVLTEIFCNEETSDNKKIFKVPEIGDIIVSSDDDPIEVFKVITGHDLTDFYKNFANKAFAEISENNVKQPESNEQILENDVLDQPENYMEIPKNGVEILEIDVAKILENKIAEILANNIAEIFNNNIVEILDNNIVEILENDVTEDKEKVKKAKNRNYQRHKKNKQKRKSKSKKRK